MRPRAGFAGRARPELSNRRPRGQTEAQSGQYTNGGNWRERALRLSPRDPRN